MEHDVSNGFGNRSGKEGHSTITIGLSKSEKTEDGTGSDYTVSISTVYW